MKLIRNMVFWGDSGCLLSQLSGFKQAKKQNICRSGKRSTMQPRQLPQQFVSNRIFLIVFNCLLFISCATQQSQTTSSQRVTSSNTAPTVTSFAAVKPEQSNNTPSSTFRTRLSSPPLTSPPLEATTKLPIPSKEIVTLDEQQIEQQTISPEASPDTTVVNTQQTVEATKQTSRKGALPEKLLPLPAPETPLNPEFAETNPKTTEKQGTQVKAIDEAVRPLGTRDPFVRWDKERQEAVKSTQEKEAQLLAKDMERRMATNQIGSKDETAKEERSIVLRVLLGVALLSFIAVFVLRSNVR